MENQAYFSAIYGKALCPIAVLDEQLKFVYRNAAFSEFCADQGAEESFFLDERAAICAKKCLDELQGENLSLSFLGEAISAFLSPCFYEGEKYLVFQPQRSGSALKREEMVRILRNSHDRLLKYLNELYGISQNLEESSKERKALGDGVRRIMRMANHLYQAMDRGGTMEYRVPMNLGAFVQCYLEQFTKLTGKKILVQLKNENYYAKIMPEDLELILGTLLSNAVRFGGEDVAVRLEEEGELLVLSVWDSGNGVADSNRLFEWGWRTVDKSGKKGLGYSLPMAKMLAERQGASLEYAERDGGACFALKMERESAPAAVLAEWQAEPYENSLSQIRVELSDL